MSTLNAQLALQGSYTLRNTAELVVTFAAGLLTGFKGVLTGTITTPAQLPATAFSIVNSTIAGTGDWTVYDADAHPSYPGCAVVLRKPCASAPGLYKYLFLFFYGGTGGTTPVYCNVSGVIGFMGGWDATAKAPTTLMTLSTGATVAVGTSAASSVVPHAGAIAAAAGTASSPLIAGNIATNGTSSASPTYQLIDTADTTCYWPCANLGNAAASTFPFGVQFEYVPVSGWANPAAGCVPVVSAQVNSASAYAVPYVVHTRDASGAVVLPATSRVNSALAVAGAAGLGSAAHLINKYLLLDDGSTAIPLAPLEVSATSATNSALAYLGRAASLFATNCSLAIGDSFSDGTSTYIVVPTGYHVAIAAGASGAAHSPSARLALKVS